MNKQTIVINYDKNDGISSFAFSLGKTIENIISVETDNLKLKNNILEGLILDFSFCLTGELYEKYIKHFNIKR